MRLLIFLLATGLIVGCGVSGRPLPPLEPAEIGDGEVEFERPVVEPETEEDDAEDEL